MHRITTMSFLGSFAILVVVLLVTTPLSAQPTWTIEARPELLLTRHDEDFNRIAGMSTFPNGTIAVADEGDGRVLFFGAEGTPRARVGRLGSGPGEYLMMIWLGSCGRGTVSVYDAALSRVTDLDAAGNVTATRPGVVLLGPPAARREVRPYGLSCAPNGAIAAVGGPRTVSPSPGSYRPQVPLGVSRVGPALTLIGQVPGSERYRWPRSEGPRFFGRPTLIAATPTKVFVGTADSFFVESFDYAGRRLGALQHTVRRKPLTAEDREAWLQRNINRLGGRVSEFHVRFSMLADGVLPELLPAYERFLVDGERLWVEEATPLTARFRTWWGFDEQGQVFARLTIPVELSLYEISATSVAGKWTDSEGVESVRRYRLKRVGQ